MLALFIDAVPALSQHWFTMVSTGLYLTVYPHKQYLQTSSSCQADGAAEQLISKSRIFRGRSLGSAMI